MAPGFVSDENGHVSHKESSRYPIANERRDRSFKKGYRTKPAELVLSKFGVLF
jgi:hypothetical protein